MNCFWMKNTLICGRKCLIWIFKALYNSPVPTRSLFSAFGEEYEDQSLTLHERRNSKVIMKLYYFSVNEIHISRNWKILILRPVAGG